MRSSNLLLLLLSLLGRATIAQDACSKYACPNGRTPTTICFIDADLTSVIRKASSAAKCGYFTEIVIAKKTSDVADKLESLAKTCASLSRMTLEGHGEDGHQEAGNLNASSVTNLSAYGCLFAKDAEINYDACNIGRGCEGDMLFYQTAKALLLKGGRVWGPTFYSSSFLPGIVPHFSYNLRNRELTYDPSKRPPDTWTQRGLTTSDGGTLGRRCLDESRLLIQSVAESKDQARKSGCSPPNFVTDEEMATLASLDTNLTGNSRYLQSDETRIWQLLDVAIQNARSQIKANTECQPLKSSPKTESAQ